MTCRPSADRCLRSFEELMRPLAALAVIAMTGTPAAHAANQPSDKDGPRRALRGAHREGLRPHRRPRPAVRGAARAHGKAA